MPNLLDPLFDSGVVFSDFRSIAERFRQIHSADGDTGGFEEFFAEPCSVERIGPGANSTNPHPGQAPYNFAYRDKPHQILTEARVEY